MKQNLLRGFLVSFFLLLAVLGAGTSVQAASVAATNKKADKAFDARIASLRADSDFPLRYAYVDLTGDKIHEALVEYRPRSNKGSDDTFSVFAYQKGAVKQILSIREYGLTKCTYYTKTKSLILYGTGRGGEWHRYFQINGTRYKDIVQRIRKSTAGGGTEYGPWQYTMGKNKTKITKAKFISLRKPLLKGTKRTLSSWKKLS